MTGISDRSEVRGTAANAKVSLGELESSLSKCCVQDPNADEHGSTCLLIFKAGPPYEDIAFKILNKEWEYSHKKGFKSTFERGILHLYFNFKRNRYRR